MDPYYDSIDWKDSPSFGCIKRGRPGKGDVIHLAVEFKFSGKFDPCCSNGGWHVWMHKDRDYVTCEKCKLHPMF